MLKNVLFQLNDRKDDMSEANPTDTLIVTDDLEIYGQWKKKDYALLFVDASDSFVDGVEYITDSVEELEDEYLELVFCRQKKLPMRIFVTERTLVREMCEADIDELYELYDDDEVRRFIEPLYEREEELQYIRDYVHNRYELYGFGMWLIFDRLTRRLIGRAGIDLREIDGKEQPEIGYMIARDYRCKGYATEVCKRILLYAEGFGFEGLNVVTSADNEASIATAQKLGGRLVYECEEQRIYRIDFNM